MRLKLSFLLILVSFISIGQADMEIFFLSVDMGYYSSARKMLSNFEAEKELEKYLNIHENGIFPDEKLLGNDADRGIKGNIQLLLKGLTIYLKYGSGGGVHQYSE